MEERILEEARQLGVNVLDGIDATSKQFGSYLYSKYRMTDADYTRNYRYTLENKLIPTYGLELLLRVSFTDLRDRIGQEPLTDLKRNFTSGVVPTYEEVEQMDSRYRYAILHADMRDYTARWTDFGAFFLRYEERVDPISSEEIQQHLRQRSAEILGLAEPVHVAMEPSGSVPEVAGVADDYARASEAGVANLEDMYRKLMERQDYRAELHQHVAGPYGGQIDIVASKGDEVILVECKDWKEGAKATIDELHIFRSKFLDARGNYPGKQIRPVFVSTAGFTDPAKTFARQQGIETIEGLELAKEFLEWGIIGVTIKGNAYYIVGPLATQPAARYNRDSPSIVLR